MNKECNRCLFTSDFSRIMPDGECEYCKIHDKLEAMARPEDLYPILNKIKTKGGKYNCLIGISGGLDSSVLLWAAVKLWGLKPLVIHFDNGWNNEQAENNMKALTEHLGVNSITYRIDKTEYTLLNYAFLSAGVPDADIPNDIAMTKLMYDTAHKYGIKYILNGHDFRTEGSTPRDWTYMDAKYIRSVYRAYMRQELKNYPLFTFSDQIFYALMGIKQVRPFHFGFNRAAVECEMKNAIAWSDYGGKHCENVYTEYVGAELLPKKFNIDKRIVYVSAQIRSGMMTKDHGKILLSQPPNFDWSKFPDAIAERITLLQGSEIMPRYMYDKYNFKLWRPVIWILYKMGVVPQTFYIKYCF